MDGSFKINLSENHLKAGDNFTNDIWAYQVLESPKRKWYKVLIQYLTFGLKKAPYEYKIKLVQLGDIHIIDSKDSNLKSCVNNNLYCCGIDEYDKDISKSKGGIGDDKN